MNNNILVCFNIKEDDDKTHNSDKVWNCDKNNDADNKKLLIFTIFL